MADQLKEAIQAKIRKYQMLLELADDPETREMLKSLVVANGNGHQPSHQTSSGPVKLTTDKTKPPYGHLKKTVFEVLSSAKNPITTDGIVEEMRKRNFEFKSKTPSVAVNEALNTLLEDEKARISGTVGVRNFWVATGSAQELTH